jgi:hypothetical protein
MKKALLNKIIKQCGCPEIFCFEEISGTYDVEDIRKMREYVKCTNKVEREYKKKKQGK